MSSPSCSTFLSDIQRRIAGLSLADIAPHQLLTGCRRCRSSIVDRDMIDMLTSSEVVQSDGKYERNHSLITGRADVTVLQLEAGTNAAPLRKSPCVETPQQHLLCDLELHRAGHPLKFVLRPTWHKQHVRLVLCEAQRALAVCVLRAFAMGAAKPGLRRRPNAAQRPAAKQALLGGAYPGCLLSTSVGWQVRRVQAAHALQRGYAAAVAGSGAAARAAGAGGWKPMSRMTGRQRSQSSGCSASCPTCKQVHTPGQEYVRVHSRSNTGAAGPPAEQGRLRHCREAEPQTPEYLHLMECIHDNLPVRIADGSATRKTLAHGCRHGIAGCSVLALHSYPPQDVASSACNGYNSEDLQLCERPTCPSELHLSEELEIMTSPGPEPSIALLCGRSGPWQVFKPDAETHLRAVVPAAAALGAVRALNADRNLPDALHGRRLAAALRRAHQLHLGAGRHAASLTSSVLTLHSADLAEVWTDKHAASHSRSARCAARKQWRASFQASSNRSGSGDLPEVLSWHAPACSSMQPPNALIRARSVEHTSADCHDGNQCQP